MPSFLAAAPGGSGSVVVNNEGLHRTVTPDPMTFLESRRLRNKEAARKMRQRKKRIVDVLRAELTTLSKETSSLASSVAKAEAVTTAWWREVQKLQSLARYLEAENKQLQHILVQLTSMVDDACTGSLPPATGGTIQ